MNVKEQLLQGSDEWFEQRLGRPTASEFKRIITAKTARLSESRHDYINELVAENYMPREDCAANTHYYTGQKFIGNKYTDHGNDTEPEARQAFAEQTGRQVVEVGFVLRADGIVGCSPDGLVLDENGDYAGGLEIKCKILKNHLKVLRTGKLPDEHKAQVHGSLAITGLPVWYFWSYFPGFPGVCIEVRPDAYTAKVGAALDEFLVELAKAQKEVKGSQQQEGDLI